MPTKVTDPELLKQLNDEPVTDPELIKKLNSTDFSAGTMAANLWPSAKQFATDVVTPILNPVDTASALSDLASGAYHKTVQSVSNALPDSIVERMNQAQNKLVDENFLGSGLLMDKTPVKKSNMQYRNLDTAEGVMDFFGDRYGSVDAVKETVMQDPVGVLGDASGLLLGGASVLPKTSKAAQIAKTAGASIDPVNAVLNTGKTTAGLLTPKALPNSMYQSAAKFHNAVNSPDPKTLSDTALKYGLLPTADGVGRLELAVNKIGDEIDVMIKAADESGVRIPKSAVFKNLKELRQDLGGVRLHGSESKTIINEIAKRFDEHMKSLGKETLTPSELQAFKKDIYDALNYNTIHLTGVRAAEKTQKAIARAAKEIIENQNPDIAVKNQQLGELLELKRPLQQAARRIDKRNPLSLDTGVYMGGGGALHGPEGAMAGAGMSLLQYPKIQSGLASQLNKFKNRGLLNLTSGSVPLGIVEQALFQSGRERNRGLLDL